VVESRAEAERSHMLAGDVSQETVEQLSDMRNLIVLLLGHEMERAVAWNNPLSRPDKAFTKDVERFAVRHRRATARDWRVHVRAAWRASVHVAVRLGDRFRHSAAVREALAARIVQSGAARLAGDGDAVTAALLAVLEHGSSRKEDVVEQTLTALSRWAPTSPTAALRLLRTDFRSDSRVIDYALRSLRRCSVRAVIFLIPQLVQALRYDRTGLVEQFLRAAGRASELVAHQIIWNARIYTIKDDAGNTDGDLAPVAQRLSDAVVAQFDEQRAKTYRLVFDFFENFTNASALLIKLKHTIEADEPGLAKDEIRARLTKRLFVELQKTPVEQVIGVAYLPTNPHWMVHDIVASKSFALQSAAKVPLFVSFTVSDRQHLPHAIAAVPDDVGAEQQRNEQRRLRERQRGRRRSGRAWWLRAMALSPSTTHCSTRCLMRRLTTTTSTTTTRTTTIRTPPSSALPSGTLSARRSTRFSARRCRVAFARWLATTQR
jgi:hypothetical protein